MVLLPVALLTEQPWQLRPGLTSLTAAAVLSVFCTAIALQIYFRLIRTLGSLGAASQAYLRAGVGVLLGMVFLGERLEPATAAGLACAIAGVFLINWPAGAISALRQSWPFPHSKAAEHATSGKNR